MEYVLLIPHLKEQATFSNACIAYNNIFEQVRVAHRLERLRMLSNRFFMTQVFKYVCSYPPKNLKKTKVGFDVGLGSVAHVGSLRSFRTERKMIPKT